MNCSLFTQRNEFSLHSTNWNKKKCRTQIVSIEFSTGKKFTMSWNHTINIARAEIFYQTELRSKVRIKRAETQKIRFL